MLIFAVFLGKTTFFKNKFILGWILLFIICKMIILWSVCDYFDWNRSIINDRTHKNTLCKNSWKCWRPSLIWPEMSPFAGSNCFASTGFVNSSHMCIIKCIEIWRAEPCRVNLDFELLQNLAPGLIGPSYSWKYDSIYTSEYKRCSWKAGGMGVTTYYCRIQ